MYIVERVARRGRVRRLDVGMQLLSRYTVTPPRSLKSGADEEIHPPVVEWVIGATQRLERKCSN